MSKTVFVLEDEPALLHLLKELLEIEGFQAFIPDLANLWQDLRAQRPAAILMDVNLKGVNGLDLLGKIRADEDLKGLVVLLSSGQDFRQEALQREADGFLMKPYMPDDLMNILRDKLNL